MQFADVNSIRSKPFSKGRGVCSICGSPVLAKCGDRIIHHWAHKSRRSCDPWWENETAWHRSWKRNFPDDWLEVSHVAPDGEVHRADIKTPNGIVVEVQHSQMSDAERLSREAFYKNLVWIVDGRGFEKNFDIYHLLPDPAAEIASDTVWVKATRRAQGAARGIFFLLSECQKEYPEATKSSVKGGYYHFINEIEEQIKLVYRGHHQYDWVRPRRTWLDATCPVYIDFGRNYLVKLDTYDESGMKCVFLVSMEKFLHDVKTESCAANIGKRLYANSLFIPV